MTSDAVKIGCALALLWTTIPATGQHQLFEDGELGAVMADIRQRTHDRIPAIDRPTFLSADSAAIFVADGDLVIGVVRGKVAKAYPVKFLNGREVVNDSLGSGPITVTW